VVPLVLLEVRDAAGEEPGGHQIQEAGAGDEEDLQRGGITTAVDDVADQTARGKAGHGRKGYGCCRQTETDTADEDDGFEALAQDSDEREDEHDIFLTPVLEASAEGSLAGRVLGFDGFSELDAPFGLEFGNAEEGCAHDGDNDGGNDGEDAFPEVLCRAPSILA